MNEAPLVEPGAGLSLRDEIVWYWQRWPRKTVWFVLLGMWLVLFQFLGNSTFGYIDTHSLFRWMHYSYTHSSDDEHGMLIPLVVIILFWWKRREMRAVISGVWWPSVGLILLALLIHLGAYTVQQTRVSIVAFFLGLYGLLGLVWGRRFMFQSFFPMVLFAFTVPLSTVGEFITHPLRILVTKISVMIGHGILGMSVGQDGSRVLGPDGLPMYDVVAACSGIRSLTVLGAVTLIYAFVSFQTVWKRLVILLAAIPLAVAGNTARITTVMILGDAFGKDLAMRFEQYLGLVTFVVALGLLLGVGSWLREKPASAAGTTPQDGMPAKSSFNEEPGWVASRGSWVAVAVVAALTALTTFALLHIGTGRRLGEPGLKLTAEPTHIQGGGVARDTSVLLPHQVPDYSSEPLEVTPLEVDWLPKDTLFGRRRYSSSKDHFTAQLSVVLMGTDRTSIHKPQYCLVGEGWRIDETLADVIPMTRPYPYDLHVNKLLVSKKMRNQAGQVENVRGIYVYWFVADKLLTPSHGERMWWMARDLIRTGVLQRWAYVSYFTGCPPGYEGVTFNRLKELIADTVPEFQLAAGVRSGVGSTAAATSERASVEKN